MCKSALRRWVWAASDIRLQTRGGERPDNQDFESGSESKFRVGRPGQGASHCPGCEGISVKAYDATIVNTFPSFPSFLHVDTQRIPRIPCRLKCKGKSVPEHAGLWYQTCWQCHFFRWLHPEKYALAQRAYQERISNGNNTPPPSSPQFSDAGLDEISVEELQLTSEFFNDFYLSYCPGAEQSLLNDQSLSHERPVLHVPSRTCHIPPPPMSQSSRFLDIPLPSHHISLPPPESLYGPPPPASQSSRSRNLQECPEQGCRKPKNGKCGNGLCKGHCIDRGGCAQVPDHKPPLSSLSQYMPYSSTQPSSSLFVQPTSSDTILLTGDPQPLLSQPPPPSSQPRILSSTTSSQQPPLSSQPRIPLSSTSANTNTARGASRGAQYYTQTTDKEGVNIEMERASLRQEKVKGDVISRLAASEVAVFAYSTSARPLPRIIQGEVVNNRIQMTQAILDKVRISGDSFFYYRYGMRSWMEAESDTVVQLSDAMKVDGIILAVHYACAFYQTAPEELCFRHRFTTRIQLVTSIQNHILCCIRLSSTLVTGFELKCSGAGFSILGFCCLMLNVGTGLRVRLNRFIAIFDAADVMHRVMFGTEGVCRRSQAVLAPGYSTCRTGNGNTITDDRKNFLD
ncbi:hypothetical protein K435DRAFT_811666 [Dendrothele bispora CBS 962.96]|uniref:Uncharacterized protein n=1 Tax=Dendrothele bispora (strain CBS 962.96) TaxID=1314807 RepID=A0A4V6T4X4_DENBC|nr:hypothetical protein K435DRAFT_811666 [Dendrothele bispora CBS 962.96]